MGVSDFLVVVKEWGPVIGPMLGCLAFFIWRDWRREDRLQTRVEKLEESHNNVILPLVEKCTRVIARNTEVMRRVLGHLRRASQAGNDQDKCVLDRLLADAASARQKSEP